MKEKFIEWNPRQKAMVLLTHINTIATHYKEQGYKLTLRQMYYQLVSKDIIPNSERSYKMIGDIVSKGRLSGFIDWDIIEDRGRKLKRLYHDDSPSQALKDAAELFHLDWWETQENYVEVWCEKDAVSNIIEPVCRKYDVPFMANRGYSSQSAMKDAAERFSLRSISGKRLFIIYLGDHDPSGIDMTRDIDERTALLSYGTDISILRIALNMDQVEQYQPPENPAKLTDSRCKEYIKKYGSSSWELDALTPAILDQLVSEEITQLISLGPWEDTQKKETHVKKRLLEIADNFKE